MPEEEKLPIGRIAFAKTFALDWAMEHSKVVLAALIGGVAVLFCLFQMSGYFSPHKKSDYLEAQAAYSAWVSAAASDGELFKKLQTPLNRHPELEAKFGALIAQRCLSLEDQKHAEDYAKAALKRTKRLLLPYYTEFSQNSLRIADHNFSEALSSAKELKKQMEGDNSFWESRDKMVRSGHLLYAYNLLRIAALEREAGSKEGELAAWEELCKNSGWEGTPSPSKTFDPEAYAMLARTFQDGDISLIEFIQQRKKELGAG